MIVLNCGLLITRLISKNQNLDSESALNTNGELSWIKNQSEMAEYLCKMKNVLLPRILSVPRQGIWSF